MTHFFIAERLVVKLAARLRPLLLARDGWYEIRKEGFYIYSRMEYRWAPAEIAVITIDFLSIWELTGSFWNELENVVPLCQ